MEYYNYNIIPGSVYVLGPIKLIFVDASLVPSFFIRELVIQNQIFVWNDIVWNISELEPNEDRYRSSFKEWNIIR